MRLKLFRIKVRSNLSMDRGSARANLEKKMKSTEVERLRFLVDIIALIDYLFRSEVDLESSCLKDCFVLKQIERTSTDRFDAAVCSFQVDIGLDESLPIFKKKKKRWEEFEAPEDMKIR